MRQKRETEVQPGRVCSPTPGLAGQSVIRSLKSYRFFFLFFFFKSYCMFPVQKAHEEDVGERRRDQTLAPSVRAAAADQTT